MYFYDLSTSLVMKKTLEFLGIKAKKDKDLDFGMSAFRESAQENLVGKRNLANLGAGDAFMFDSRTLHGVELIESGVRYALIMFIPEKELKDNALHTKMKYEFGYEVDGWKEEKRLMEEMEEGKGKVKCKVAGVAGVDVIC